MDLRSALANESEDARAAEVALPSVTLRVTLEPREVSPDGELTFGFRVTSGAVTAEGQTPSPIAEGMRAEVAVIDHLSGTAVVTSRGIAKEVTLNGAAPLESTATGVTGQMVEQVRQTLCDLAAPFPEEEIGVGARWRKVAHLAAQDARVTQTDTFTLVELRAGRGALHDELAQTAAPQPVASHSGARDGSAAYMQSILASGDATTAFDLGRLVPQSRFTGTTTMVLADATPHEATRRTTMVLRVQIHLSGSMR